MSKYNTKKPLKRCVDYTSEPVKILVKFSLWLYPLSSISSSSTTFNNNTAIYQQALIKSG